MKKALAIIFAFFIVFSPVYSYAVLPAAVAIAGSAGGRVLVKNAIKKIAPAAIAGARKAGLAFCVRRPDLCIGGAGVVAGLIGADWTIEYTEGDNIDIYKLPPNDACEITFAYTDKKLSSSAAYSQNLAWLKANFPYNEYISHPSSSSQFQAHEKSIEPTLTKTLKPEWQQTGHYATASTYEYHASQPEYKYSRDTNFYSWYKCVPYEIQKIYITNNELEQYFQQVNISDDDMLNIYNYDYSQHPNITINGGDTYNSSGTNINNNLSKSDGADKQVSTNLKKDIESGKTKLDDVNDENCTKNDVGEYDKCGSDTEEPDSPKDPAQPEPPKPQPIECDANGFYKKVCDWMDWTQEEHTEPTLDGVEIIDKTQDLAIDENRIKFANQCPVPKSINITVVGFAFSDVLDYQPMCDFFGKLKPFVVGMGGVSSALIIAGGVRRG